MTSNQSSYTSNNFSVPVQLVQVRWTTLHVGACGYMIHIQEL